MDWRCHGPPSEAMHGPATDSGNYPHLNFAKDTAAAVAHAAYDTVIPQLTCSRMMLQRRGLRSHPMPTEANLSAKVTAIYILIYSFQRPPSLSSSNDISQYIHPRKNILYFTH